MATPLPEDVLRLFPYEPRDGQERLVAFLADTLAEGGHAVAESGTGTGKTISALTAALAVARRQGKRILYLTRTHSQARQVMVECRAIRHKLGEDGPSVVALQGRAHLCPLRKEDPELAQADADELALMCKDRMKAAEAEREGKRASVPGCRFHARGLEQGTDALAAWAQEVAPDAEALADHVAAAGHCPHLLTRRLLAESEVVVAPYVYFLQPHLRGPFLRWMNVAPADLLVVVDEAHNLAEYARELATPKLGQATLERAKQEARAFGDPTVLPGIPLSAFLLGIGRILEEAGETYLPDGVEDAILPPEEFDVMLLSTFRTATPTLDRALVVLEEYGASVREAKRRQGKVPRSYVGAVAGFLRAYRALDPMTHAPIVEREGDGVRLVAFALDPSVVTAVLNDAAGTLHLSGTLRPLEEHATSIGLDAGRARLATFPSPFPPENRLVLVDDEVTTRHEDVARDPDAWARLGERLRELRAATDRNVAIFLPSYEVLHRLAPYVRGAGSFVEVRGEAQDALMARLAAFKAGRGGTLVSVVGGRLSEGLDFPDEQLEVVILVGLPYAKPTAKGEALVRFYDRRCGGRGMGWEWAVKVPMVRRLLQAAGRLIRTPTDRGVVILLDRRAALLTDAFPGLLVTGDPASALASFFGRGHGSYGGSRLHGTRYFSGAPSRRS